MEANISFNDLEAVSISPDVPEESKGLFLPDSPEAYTNMIYKTPIQKIVSLPVRRGKWEEDHVKEIVWAKVGKLVATYDLKALEKELKVISTPAKKLLLMALWSLRIKLDTGGSQQLQLYSQPREPDKETRTVYISIRDIRNMYGKNSSSISKKGFENLKASVKDSIDRIYRMSVGWSGPGKTFKDMRILSSKGGVKDEIIYITFTSEFCEYVRENPIFMHVPSVLYRIDDHNPNALSMCLKMAQHYGIDSNYKKRQENVDNQAAAAHKAGKPLDEDEIDVLRRTEKLAVSTLLEACSDLPSYEEIKSKSNRAPTQRIIEPFMQALDSLTREPHQYLTEWTIWKPNDTPLTDDELANLGWQTFKLCYIKYIVKDDLPNQKARIVGKEKRRQILLRENMKAAKSVKRGRRSKKDEAEAAKVATA